MRENGIFDNPVGSDDEANKSENGIGRKIDYGGYSHSLQSRSETQTKLDEVIKEGENTVRADELIETLERKQESNRAKDAIEKLYGDDFDFTNPPDSLDRYEKMLALRRMEEAVISNGRIDSELPDTAPADLPNVEHAIAVIEIMKTYDGLAENNLAKITAATVARAEVRKAAADALSEIRGNGLEDEPLSLRQSLAAWIRPGGGD